MKLAYLAHPLSGDIAGNIARAKRWLAYLHREYPGVVTIAPWIHDVEALPMQDHVLEHRREALARCRVAASRCDLVILCGGRISPGMLAESEVVREILDLTHLGPEPPEVFL